jgi:hypothetical protein
MAPAHLFSGDLMQTCGEHLDSVAQIVCGNRDTVEHLSRTLSTSQLEWRPAAYGRCVAEWIESLRKSGDAALARIHEAMLPAWHDPSFEDQLYRRTVAGRCVLVSDRLRGDGHNVVHREPRRFASHAVFTEFLAQQNHLLDVIDEARDIDLGSAPAGWGIGRAFGLSVGDALELVAIRQRRGLGCVARVIATSGFPSRTVSSVQQVGGMLKLA